MDVTAVLCLYDFDIPRELIKLILYSPHYIPRCICLPYDEERCAFVGRHRCTCIRWGRRIRLSTVESRAEFCKANRDEHICTCLSPTDPRLQSCEDGRSRKHCRDHFNQD